MEISVVNKRIVFTYDDGTKWIFYGFMRQVGKYYLISIPFAHANTPLENAPKFRMKLSREEYVALKTEIVEITGYPKHSKFKRRKEVPLDFFFESHDPTAKTKKN